MCADSSDENDDSSTEMESGCEQHVACKQPSPVHQQVPTPQPRPTVASIKSRAYATPDSELSSLPESSVCDEPEKRNIHDQVKYFQRQIKKSSGLYKQSSGAEEPPKRLVVVEESGSSSKMRVRPPPQPRRPRSSVNGSGSHFSTSSSESSSNCDYTSRTLSNMGGGVGGQSPLNSDDDGGGAGIMAENGSILSLSSTRGGTDQRHFQKAIGGGASGRFNKKNGGTGGRTGGDKLGTYRGHFDDECASMSGKPVMAGGATKSPGKVAYLPHSRSYNSLNVLPTNGGGGGGAGGGIGNYATTGRHGRASNGHLAGMTGGSGNDDMQLQQHLCDLIRRHLILGYHDRIRDLFRALIRDNGRDKVEDLIDSFHNEDRDILLQLAAEVGFGLKEAESIFDIRLSRSDLNNRLHPGLSVSSLSTAEPLAGYSSGGDRMVLWRADLEELPPPPIRPPPKPMPTALLKAAIVSTETMAHVDDRVEQILQFDPTTFTELVSFLTQDCSNDVEKVRVLYRWITMYDTKFLSFDPAAPNDSLIGVLRSIKCGQMTYNELFYHLCRYAGINCQYISGYSKGAGYRPGMTIKDNRMFRNVWTAVFVAGAWRFVNCNWGARYLSSRHHNHHTSGSGGGLFSASSTLLHNTATTGTLQSLANRGTLQSQQHLQRQEEQKHRCDEFYFLTDAKQHIFEHLPDNRRWQLLNRPINLDQFMALPIVKSPFFNAGLSFKRNYAETLQTKNGKVTIKINMPRAVAVSCRLENRADGTLLRGLTLIQIIDLQTIVVTAAPSQPGKFYLSVYVSHPDDDWRFASEQTLSSTSGALEMACSFQVHCSEHNYDRLVTGRFPEVGLLGPTPAATNLGISVNPGVGPFVVWDQRSSMKVNVTVGPGLRVGHLMMSYDRSGHNSASCDSYALLQRLPGQTAVSNRGSQHQYHIRFPVDAFYCLTVFAGRSGDQDDEPTTGTAASALELQCDQDRLMQCVYRLLVDCRRPHDQVPAYPRQTSRWVNCRLMQPLDQQLQLSTHYRFSVEAPQCGAVAVVINDDPHNEWYDLRTSVKSHGLWKAKIWTGDKLDRLSVYGRLGSSAAGAAASAQQDEEYVKLLDYVLIPRLTR